MKTCTSKTWLAWTLRLTFGCVVITLCFIRPVLTFGQMCDKKVTATSDACSSVNKQNVANCPVLCGFVVNDVIQGGWKCNSGTYYTDIIVSTQVSTGGSLGANVAPFPCTAPATCIGHIPDHSFCGISCEPDPNFGDDCAQCGATFGDITYLAGYTFFNCGA